LFKKIEDIVNVVVFTGSRNYRSLYFEVLSIFVLILIEFSQIYLLISPRDNSIEWHKLNVLELHQNDEGWD